MIALTIGLAVFGLALLILLHEAGHFFATRLVGGVATRFYVGLPPAALKRTRRGVEYGIGMIPFGGYVKVIGMRPPRDEAPKSLMRAITWIEDERPHHAEPATCCAHRLDSALRHHDHAAARHEAVRMQALLELHPEMPRRIRNKALKSLEVLFESLHERAYWRLDTWRRVAIILAGPLTNLVVGLALLTLFFTFLIPVYRPTTQVVGVQPGSPAAAFGIQAGDRITTLDGTPLVDANAVFDRAEAQAGSYRLGVERADGTRVEVGPFRASGEAGQRNPAGIEFQMEHQEYRTAPLTMSVPAALTMAWLQTKATAHILFVELPRGRGTDQLASPVGIVHESNRTIREDVALYPALLGMISIAIALTNLLPFPPLDGGHVVVALVERLRRNRPLGRYAFTGVSLAGLALVLTLFGFGLFNDLTRYL